MVENVSRKVTFVATALLVSLAFLLVPEKPFQMGLDLQGGTRLVYRFDFDEAKRTDEAIAAWERRAASTPSFPLVFNNLAVAHWRLGQLEASALNLERAESLGFAVHSGFKEELTRALAARNDRERATPGN